MTVRVPLMYKIATEPSEFEQIHALNYRTFVEEIPQHASNGHRRLIDRLHDENTYIICLAGQALAGMVALRGRRPFSLDEKLPDLDRHIPPDRNPCEIRLLAVDPKFRKTIVFAGLVLRLAEVAKARGHDLALISGTTRQLKLYMHLGFVPFGPLVGSENAPYQPMMLTLDRFESRVRALLDEHSGDAQETVSFLPGPVQISPAIQRAFARPAISHREKAFADMVVRVKGCLRELTGAANVSLLLGSGTLANDVIAAQLHASAGTGLILSNGEFGERLIDHGRRSQLEFAVHRLPWGEPFDLAQLGRTMVMHRPKWIWFAHCETSTSMLNDLPGISRLCARLGIELCVDAISSLGTLPVDLGGVAFASGVSGKGFGAHSGIAIVFHRAPARPNGMPLPRYLDLSLYAAEDAVPFTQSSNLLASLDAALAELGDQRFELIRRKGQLLRQRLEESGFRCVVPAHRCAPAVVTLAAPAHISSAEVAARVARFGYKIAFGSAYLVERNWLQIAVMGDCTVQQITDLVALLRESVQARLVA